MPKLSHTEHIVASLRHRLLLPSFATQSSVCPKFEVTLRLTVSQYVLVSSTLVGLVTRYYFLSECCCLKFLVLYLWDALSDERTGLQFVVYSLNGLSRSEPVTTLYSLIWDPPNLEGQVPIFISPRNRVAQLYPPAHWVPFTLSLTTRFLRLEGYGDCGATGLIRIDRGNQSTQRKPAPSGTCPSQILHYLNWYWTRASMAWRRWQTALDTIQPYLNLALDTIQPYLNLKN
jgi:hypothetical protein